MKVRVRIEKGGRMPERKTAGAAGFDCYARSVELEGDWWVSPLGFAIEIPDGYVGLIFLRSSVYLTGLSMPNCVGVIDSDFRGELTARLSFCDDSEDSIFAYLKDARVAGKRTPYVEFGKYDDDSNHADLRCEGDRMIFMALCEKHMHYLEALYLYEMM